MAQSKFTLYKYIKLADNCRRYKRAPGQTSQKPARMAIDETTQQHHSLRKPLGSFLFGIVKITVRVVEESHLVGWVKRLAAFEPGGLFAAVPWSQLWGLHLTAT